MKFRLNQRILQDNDTITWLDPGDYEFVRIFDENRVLINTVIHKSGSKRQLTLVKRNAGEFTKEAV